MTLRADPMRPTASAATPLRLAKRATARLLRKARRLAREEGGAATAWAIMWTMCTLIVGGFVLDTTNAYRVRAQMQVTADAAALAAAPYLPSLSAAREKAIEIAALNMPPDQHGDVVSADTVEIGRWNPNGVFDASSDDPNAVRVIARRRHEEGNPVPAFLLDLVGFDAWDLQTSAVAIKREGGMSGNTAVDCVNALILSEDTVSAGGGNSLFDGVCVHGENGVQFGGNDWFSSDVKVSAADIDTLQFSSVREGSAEPEDVSYEKTRSARVLPELTEKFDEIWGELWTSGAATYSGELLPDYLYNGAGYAFVVRVDTNGWWNVQPGDLQPNTIYLVNHGLQISGGVEAHNVAIIARGQMGVGGAAGLNFSDVFLFSEGPMNMAGNVLWGDPDTYCELGRYNVYLLSEASVSLGGWGGDSGMFGVFSAAPSFSPGGSMDSSGGIYVEASNAIQLGGDVSIEGCGKELESFYEGGESPADGGIYGATLFR